MKIKSKATLHKKEMGLTLIEITLVISILLAMSYGVFSSLRGMEKWKIGKKAGEDLRLVYIAQKSYLADHPTTPVTDLTEAMLIPYLKNVANTETAIPPVDNYPVSGSPLSITVNVMPPVASSDPSGKTDDGLWDVGNP
ncbi:MAG: type II secretion system GspH family protein [Verrucomicrobiales bacterium]|nr:type II secretion system GspH family protein [Verrucomicrobiales bacterium]